MSERDPNLTCHGCAHSAAGAPFPGHPSGERPCCFCVRAPDDYTRWDEGKWYDQTPAFKTPMDNYITLDRLTQSRVSDALDRIKAGDQEVRPRGDGFALYRECGLTEGEIKDRDAVPCCAGGPVEGHAYDCTAVVGISFG